MSARPARTVVITGAAAGIGRRTALTLAGNGWTVGAFDLDETGLATLADEAGRLPGRILTGHLDVTDAAEFAERVDASGALDATGVTLGVHVDYRLLGRLLG